MSQFSSLGPDLCRTLLEAAEKEPKETVEEMQGQLEELEITKLEKKSGISPKNLPRCSPRLPKYVKNGQIWGMKAFAEAFASWSDQNRDWLDQCKEGLKLIDAAQEARLKSYVQTEIEFIDNSIKENDTQEVHTKKWKALLVAMDSVGIYVWGYQNVKKPMKDKFTIQVREALLNILKQNRTDRIAKLAMRAKIEKERLDKIEADKKAAEAARLAEAMRKRKEEESCCCCVIM